MNTVTMNIVNYQQPYANCFKAIKHQPVASISFSSTLYEASITIHISSLLEVEDCGLVHKYLTTYILYLLFQKRMCILELGEYLTSVSKQRPASNYLKLSDESWELFSRQKFAKCRGCFVWKSRNAPVCQSECIHVKSHLRHREGECLHGCSIAREVN